MSKLLRGKAAIACVDIDGQRRRCWPFADTALTADIASDQLMRMTTIDVLQG